MNIAVCGAGAWGTSIANLLAQNGNDVRIWAYEKITVENINQHHRHEGLGDAKLSDRLVATQNLGSLLDSADALVVGLASLHLSVLLDLDLNKLRQIPILILTKGLSEEIDRPFLSDYLANLLDHDRLAVLSGPNLAYEIANGYPSSTVVASRRLDDAQLFQTALSSEIFRVYTQDDVRGVECGGVFKNVIAIAGGMSDGLELGENAKAALITRGLLEIAQIATFFGGKEKTCYGLSGLGDLILTAQSARSRNRTFGEEWARGNRDDGGKTVEGRTTLTRLMPQLETQSLDLPIMRGVYAVLNDGKDPKAVFQQLMTRSLKAE